MIAYSYTTIPLKILILGSISSLKRLTMDDNGIMGEITLSSNYRI